MMGKRYARALLREAIDSGIEVLLQNKKFWKREVLDLVLDFCDESTFSEPARGLPMAELAPQFAEQVTEFDRTLSKAVMVSRAYQVLGSKYRALGRFNDAESAFKNASSEELPLLERAELYRRWAYLRMEQRNRDEALRLIEEAIFIHRTEGDLRDRHDLGCCMLARGHIHYEVGEKGLALVDISSALNHINLRRDPRRYYAAAHNLAVALVDGGTPRQLGQALDQLKSAYRILIAHKKKHLAKYKLRWLQGIIQFRYGSERQAELNFRAARAGFLDLRAPYDGAVVSLDLAICLLNDGRRRELKALAAETVRIFKALAADREALAALATWWEAAREERVTHELTKSVRRAIAELAGPVGLRSE